MRARGHEAFSITGSFAPARARAWKVTRRRPSPWAATSGIDRRVDPGMAQRVGPGPRASRRHRASGPMCCVAQPPQRPNSGQNGATRSGEGVHRDQPPAIAVHLGGDDFAGHAPATKTGPSGRLGDAVAALAEAGNGETFDHRGVLAGFHVQRAANRAAAAWPSSDFQKTGPAARRSGTPGCRRRRHGRGDDAVALSSPGWHESSAMSSQTAACTAGVLHDALLEHCARPASNCGLISATSAASPAASGRMAPARAAAE